MLEICQLYVSYNIEHVIQAGGCCLQQMAQPTEMLLVCCVLAFQTNWRSNNGKPSPIILTSKSISPNKDKQPTQDIERVEVSKGHRTLGAQLCPLGTDNEEYDYHQLKKARNSANTCSKRP
jgi:hypothetical protein